MKKCIKRLLSLALSAALCAGLCIPAMAANEENTDGVVFSVTLDQSQINVSDTDQTVTMTIEMSKEAAIDSMEFIVNYDAPLTIPDKPTDIPDGFSSWGAEASKLAWMNSTAQTVSVLGKVTFTVPANTSAGTYNVGVSGIMLSNNRAYWETTATASTTLTIVDPSNVPATGAALSQETATVINGATVTLSASLLPVNTSESISSVAWESSNTDVATVADGVVTGVGEGEATITATVTTSAGSTYTAQCAVTVTASPYIITISDGVDGTAEVKAGDTVTMNLSISGGAFGGAQGTVTYDPALFTFVSSAAADGNGTVNSDVKENEGTITYDVENTEDYAAGDTFLTLTFTAKDVTASTTGDFTLGTTFTAAKANVLSREGAVKAAAVNDAVRILAAFTVNLKNEEGNVIYTEDVLDGKTVTVADITDPVKDNYVFVGWTNGTDTYTTEQLGELVITEPVELTAKFASKTFAVTLPDGADGADTATYGEPYTVTVTDYDSANWDYTVTYTVGDSTEVLTATDNGDGTFTIPGADITGDITVTLKKELKGVTVQIIEDYVNGYSLIIAVNDSGDDSVVYTVANGGDSTDVHAMYKDEIHGGYTWLVAGTADTSWVGLADAGTAAAGTIADTKDVNASGGVNYEDMLAVWYCVNKTNYDPIANMDAYLRADLNKNNSVTVADLLPLR